MARQREERGKEKETEREDMRRTEPASGWFFHTYPRTHPADAMTNARKRPKGQWFYTHCLTHKDTQNRQRKRNRRRVKEKKKREEKCIEEEKERDKMAILALQLASNSIAATMASAG